MIRQGAGSVGRISDEGTRTPPRLTIRSQSLPVSLFGRVPVAIGSPSRSTFLGEDRFHHFTVDIGQTVVPSLESIRQLRVVETKQVHDRGLQVMDVNLIPGD